MNRENTMEITTPFDGITLPAQRATEGLIGGVAGARETLQRWIIAARMIRARSHAIRELRALSDNMLKDIGIPRSHIASTVDTLVREEFNQD